MRNTKSIQNGLKNLLVKGDEVKLLKIKSLVSKFRNNSHSNIPITQKTLQNQSEKDKTDDILRYEYFKLLSENPNNESVKKFLREKQSLYYISKAAQEDMERKQALQEKQYFNIATEINKKFNIKKVEGNKNSFRCGLLGYKIGMTGVWDKFGTWHPLSVIKIDRCQVVSHKTAKNSNYHGLELGVGEKSVKKITRPLLGHFIKHGIPPKKDTREFRITPENVLPSGYVLTVRHFVPGQLVDVQGVTKGHGWTGVMKKWNFKGGAASHGNSLNHRAAGSIGNREWPGKVWKGKKMSGRLGGENNTKENIRVYRIDYDRNLLYIIGSIPGNEKSLVLIKDSIKKHEFQYHLLHFPTFIDEPDKKYPSISEWTGVVDRNEIFQHDNDEILGTSEEEEEGEPEKNADEDISSKK